MSEEIFEILHGMVAHFTLERSNVKIFCIHALVLGLLYSDQTNIACILLGYIVCVYNKVVLASLNIIYFTVQIEIQLLGYNF